MSCTCAGNRGQSKRRICCPAWSRSLVVVLSLYLVCCCCVVVVQLLSKQEDMAEAQARQHAGLSLTRQLLEVLLLLSSFFLLIVVACVACACAVQDQDREYQRALEQDRQN